MASLLTGGGLADLKLPACVRPKPFPKKPGPPYPAIRGLVI